MAGKKYHPRLINTRRSGVAGYPRVDIYIHARHRGNPRGTGEAVAVLEFVSRKGVVHVRKATAAVGNDTKNALTLKVIVSALKMLIKPCEVMLHTDNEYIKSCVALGWLETWRQQGWTKANGKQPANMWLWKGFYISMQIHKITFMPYGARREFVSGGD